MKKILISLGLTIFLGPGVGHLYLKKFKKGIIFIGVVLITAMHLAWKAGKSIAITPDITKEKVLFLFQEFTRNNSKVILYYDIIFAAVWAYAIIDAFNIAKKSLPSSQKNPEDENENS
ncbi:MAG: hypothetical protein NT145_02460 [Elusimicrobia bacterium]|nr:hypothetical protein [Elusimicrobiota bacterium]